MHIQKYCHAPRGLQNAIEGQGKDLGILVALLEDWYLCILDLLSLAKGKSTRGIPPCTW